MTKSRSDRQRKKRHSTPAHSATCKDLPSTHWAHAVALIADRIKAAEVESNKESPEDPASSDFNVVRARALSSQI